MKNSTPRPDPDPGADDAFDELVQSLPDLAEMGTADAATETVEIQIPNPAGGPPMKMSLEVPTEIAPMLRESFEPEHIDAIVAAIDQLARAAMPPR